MDISTPHPFRSRLLAGEKLLGTFLKLPVPHVVEVLGLIGYDFVILDEEHADWTRQSLSAAILAARATGMASIVRVTGAEDSSIQFALDCGATGVMVPHVDSQAKAKKAVAAARYLGGTRGAGAGRGSFYGLRGANAYELADAETCVIAMIEDAGAIGAIDGIAAVEGIDAIFVGRGDLALSMRNAVGEAADVKGAIDAVAVSAKAAGKRLAAFAYGPDTDDFRSLSELGVTAFAMGADLAYIQQVAKGIHSAFRKT